MTYDIGVFTRRRIISPAESYFAVPAVAPSSYTGPGDTYGAALGWYGVRGYSTAYATGSNFGLRLENSTSTGHTDILILSDGTLDVATAGPLVATNKVSILYDQSGNGLNVLQTDDTKRPTLVVSDATTGRPAIVFATGNYLRSSGSTSSSQPITYSFVSKRTTVTGNNCVLMDNSAGLPQMGYSAAANKLETYNGAGAPQANASDNVWHTVQHLLNGTTSTAYYVDGTSTSGLDGATGGFGSSAIDIGGGINLNFFIGTLAEIGLWAGDKTSGFGSVNVAQKAWYSLP